MNVWLMASPWILGTVVGLVLCVAFVLWVYNE